MTFCSAPLAPSPPPRPWEMHRAGARGPRPVGRTAAARLRAEEAPLRDARPALGHLVRLAVSGAQAAGAGGRDRGGRGRSPGGGRRLDGLRPDRLARRRAGGGPAAPTAPTDASYPE